MSLPPEILSLIERFHTHCTADYNETQTRLEFINPLFKQLGWDINNEKNQAHSYKEVVHEDAIKVGRATKAPDYSFRVGGQRKFFLEAKKPSVSIKNNAEAAYQLRRYGWSAKLSLSILTNFAEFSVYDCRFKPSEYDSASTARILYFNFEEYADYWQIITDVFSQQAVESGGFYRYAEQNRRKRGTQEVDAAFLEQIEGWRDILANNLILRNAHLTSRQLNFTVQQTIDRIVFLRICEDRGIEKYGQLLKLIHSKNIYSQLLQHFYHADARYNSGLFHFQAEQHREQPDLLTPLLQIDDKPLKDILKHLYYPASPYEFSVLSADILGQIYEQFLGKVIYLTAQRAAIVEDKPEVKKAGGVFYTPTYIVDYIVKNTIGVLLAEKQLKKPPILKIIDPACGSGSFLLGVYQYLLDWHKDFYLQHPQKWSAMRNPPLIPTLQNEWKLSINERKRILLDNIFGVDIDSQAVEVTKLSLLLKVLEGEDDQTLGIQLNMLKDRVLPDLDHNIKCGNSLISGDFYATQQLGLLNEEEIYRINAFDWQKEFNAILKNGGFDVVLGNPPYIRIQSLREWTPLEADFYKKKYQTAAKGNYDIYVVFIERMLQLLNQKGRLGYILPSKFFSTDYGSIIRQILSSNRFVEKVVDFRFDQVFSNSTTYTCLLFLNKETTHDVMYASISTLSLKGKVEPSFESFPYSDMNNQQWVFSSPTSITIFKKISINTTSFGMFIDAMARGISTGADEVFCLFEKNGKILTPKGKELNIERNLLKKPIYANDFSRFLLKIKNDQWIIFPYKVNENNYNIIPEQELAVNYPNAYQYLIKQRSRLEKRKQSSHWYGYSAPRSLNIHQNVDILVPLLANKGLCAPSYSSEQHCFMASAGFGVKIKPNIPVDKFYLFGIINSKLMFWYLSLISNKFRGGWITCTKQYFEKIPIYQLDFSKKNEKIKHDRIVELVKHLIGLHQQLDQSTIPHSGNILRRQIEAIDDEIDQQIYQLYELTDAEIEQVEAIFSAPS